LIRPKYIVLRLLLVFVPVLMALAPAKAQNTVYAGETSELSVIPVPGETYDWELYNVVDGLNLAAMPGNILPSEAIFVGGIKTGVSVSVTWLKPGIYYFKVTVTNSCTDNVRVGMMIVKEALPTASLVLNPNEVCAGSEANLLITFTGTAPWSFKLEANDGINTPVITTYSSISNNPFSIVVKPATNTTYRVVEITDSNGVNPDPSEVVTLVVKPLPKNSKIYLVGQ